jgi:hypothetical protein
MDLVYNFTFLIWPANAMLDTASTCPAKTVIDLPVPYSTHAIFYLSPSFSSIIHFDYRAITSANTRVAMKSRKSKTTAGTIKDTAVLGEGKWDKSRTLVMRRMPVADDRP